MVVEIDGLVMGVLMEGIRAGSVFGDTKVIDTPHVVVRVGERSTRVRVSDGELEDSGVFDPSERLKICRMIKMFQNHFYRAWSDTVSLMS